MYVCVGGWVGGWVGGCVGVCVCVCVCVCMTQTLNPKPQTLNQALLAACAWYIVGYTTCTLFVRYTTLYIHNVEPGTLGVVFLVHCVAILRCCAPPGPYICTYIHTCMHTHTHAHTHTHTNAYIYDAAGVCLVFVDVDVLPHN